MTPEVYTYADALDHLSDFLQGHGQSADQAKLRRAILAAYREVTAAHDWSFLTIPGRIQLRAPQTTGTVVYTHATRILTLTGATWPQTWVEDAAVRFDGLVCDVQSYTDGTNVVLDAITNPGADVASTTYSLYPRWYALPADFAAFDGPLEETTWLQSRYISPKEWLSLDRYRSDTGDVSWYTVMAVPDLYGQMGLFIHPPSNAAETLDFVYKRRPRGLRYSGHDTAEMAGTVTISAGSASVTGHGTGFSAAMVGSLLRIGDSSTYWPTGIEGGYPYVEQRSIKTRTVAAGAAAITLDAGVTLEVNSKKYRVTDPIDFDAAAIDALLRCAEKQIARLMNLKDRAEITKLAADAMQLARWGDTRIRQRRVVGDAISFRRRLADYTNRPQVP